MFSYTSVGFYMLFLVIFFHVPERFDCSGVVEIEFLSSGNCSQNVSDSRNKKSGKSCNVREFFACLIKGQNNKTCVSNQYTAFLHDYCNTTLNSTVCLKFAIPWNGIQLQASMHARNQTNCSLSNLISTDTKDIAFYNLVRSAESFEVEHTIHRGDMPFRDSTLGYHWSVYCDKNFYGNQCDKFCETDRTTANCTKDGTRICKTGWNGTSCTTPQCSSKGCENNGTCKNESCICEPNYTGTLCESRLAENSSSSERQTKTDDSGSNVALYAGISVGVILVVALAVGAAYFIFRKKHRVGENSVKETEDPGQSPDLPDGNDPSVRE